MACQDLVRRPGVFIHEHIPRCHFFSPETRNLFFQTFRTHFSCEENAELTRARLNRRKTWNVHDAFAAIDLSRDGFVTGEEFRMLLVENGFFPTDCDIMALVMRFDRNCDGRVTYADFMEELLPRGTSNF